MQKTTHIVAVGNQKGGVGKTTNTVNLSAALAELGRKCLIWDLDMNHGATRHFGVSPDAFLGSFEVLTGAEDPSGVILTPEEMTEEDGVSLPPNIHLIPANRKLEKIDQALMTQNKFIVMQDVLIKPLQSLMGQYDYVFLDTAPNATTPTVAAYKASRWFILSAMPDPFAIAGLNDALTDIQGAQQNGNPTLQLLGVIISGVDNRTRLATTIVDYVDKAFSPDGKKSAKFNTTISRSTVVPESQKVGQTLMQSAPAHKVTEQYRALAREVEARITELTRPAQPKVEVTINPAVVAKAAGQGSIEPTSDVKEVANG
jgi:chromosome partitioning protein